MELVSIGSFKDYNMPKQVPQYLTTTTAITLAANLGVSVTRPTVVSWCKKYKLGFRLGKKGRWQIDKSKFTNFIKGTGDHV